MVIKMIRCNWIVWIGACLLLQAPWLVAADHDPPPGNRPTQLEDIERDNLNSERQVFKKEAIAQQQQQHGASSSQSNNHYTVQIQHHPGSTAGTHSSVKYVTPLPAPTQTLTYSKDHAVPQQYVSIPQQQQPPLQFHQQQPQQQVPQVHEAHSTYTVPSRQSLLQPVIGGGAPASPYLTPQPQYVYVQARPQPLPQYAADNSLPQQLLHILPQNSQAYIMIPTPYYQQQQQQQAPHASAAPTGPALPSITPPSSPATPHSAQQLAAYVNDPDNHIQTYSHGETGAQSPATGATVQPTPQPDVVYAASSTPAPPRHQSPSAEFSIVKSVEQPVYFSHDLPPLQSNKLHGDGSVFQFGGAQVHHPVTGRLFTGHAQQLHHHHQQLHHHQQPPHQLHYPTYVQPHGHSYAGAQQQLHYPSLAHPNNGILNYFGVQQRPPTSLLDSYVPSSLQLAKTPLYTTKLAPHAYPAVHHGQLHHQQPRPVQFYQQGAVPVYPVNPLHTTILQPAGPAGHGASFPHAQPFAMGQHPSGPSATAPGYNTIAYSVPLAFTKTSAQYKRSPALFSVAGFARPSTAGLATTKLQPAKQFA
uniref:ataxin-2 homolog n=1 Tax=Anopheles coluzzii TaxID=1518534 RepID=UPI0020FFD349|nr:ataxin-2 homolog [Anopheles coluzzii]